MQQNSKAKIILIAGFALGVLDILIDFIWYLMRGGENIADIFRFIASGVFGITEASSDKIIMPIAGAIFHFIIAYLWTIFLFLIYPKINWLKKNKIIAGFVYGIFIWTVMTLVVLPLSNTPKIPFNFNHAIISMFILIITMGLPLSFIANKYYADNRNFNN